MKNCEKGDDMPEKESWTWINSGVAAPQGFWATGVQAGVKYPDKYDVAVLVSEVPAQVAGVFTRNLVKAHPVLLCQQRLVNGQAQAVVMNSGNANACVGPAGDEAAMTMAAKTAECLGLDSDNVLVASTGVIGVEMPVAVILKGIEAAVAEIDGLRSELGSLSNGQVALDEARKFGAAHKAALAIMTTDLAEKEFACELPCQGGNIRLGAIAKGSGMIHPNMGTMLGFLTTDAVVPAEKLQTLLAGATDESFNMVTVDGDTSTNDSVIFLANGASGITPEGEDWEKFAAMVKAVCVRLAQAIARDGEGATKFLEVQVSGAATTEDARKIAKSVCGSSLVKTAIFGEDPNWGRILAAMGYAGANFDPSTAGISLGDIVVAREGRGVEFPYAAAKQVLAQKDIVIKIRLSGGEAQATAWGCDLSYDYVKINGSYTT